MKHLKESPVAPVATEWDVVVHDQHVEISVEWTRRAFTAVRQRMSQRLLTRHDRGGGGRVVGNSGAVEVEGVAVGLVRRLDFQRAALEEAAALGARVENGLMWTDGHKGQGTLGRAVGTVRELQIRWKNRSEPRCPIRWPMLLVLLRWPPRLEASLDATSSGRDLRLVVGGHPPAPEELVPRVGGGVLGGDAFQAAIVRHLDMSQVEHAESCVQRTKS
jgi:hypothetical protein